MQYFNDLPLDIIFLDTTLTISNIPGVGSSTYRFLSSDLNGGALTVTNGVVTGFGVSTIPVSGSNPNFTAVAFYVNSTDPGNSFIVNSSYDEVLQRGTGSIVPEPSPLAFTVLSFVGVLWRVHKRRSKPISLAVRKEWSCGRGRAR